VQRAREGGAAFVLVLPLAGPGGSLPAVPERQSPAALPASVTRSG
jgi:hypothetical protein